MPNIWSKFLLDIEHDSEVFTSVVNDGDEIGSARLSPSSLLVESLSESLDKKENFAVDLYYTILTI